MSQPQQGTGTARTALPWPARRHEAYPDSRPDATSRYNPAAEYGDPDWREPASNLEAAARTTWLAENTPSAPGWPTRPLTPVEVALQDAAERAVLSDGAHDDDPYAWVEYERLKALDRLAPAPAHDALNDLPLDEHGRRDTLTVPERHHAEWRDQDQVVRDHRADEAAFDGQDDGDTANGLTADRDGPFTDAQGRWPPTGAWAAGTCDPSRANTSGYLEAPDDPERLRQRIEALRAALDAEAQESLPDDEQRREQLVRWHDDDHYATHTGTGADLDSFHHETGDGGQGESGWAR